MKSGNVLFLVIFFLIVPGISRSQTSANNIKVGSAGTYSTIQNGYNNAGNGNTIQVQAGTYVENDDFNRNETVALIGGYDSSFSTDSSNSVITGSLTISNGTVTVENIIIKPPPLSPTLVSIAVTPVNPGIPLGTTQQFGATGTFSDNSTQNLTTSVTWSSSNVAVATISNAAGTNGRAVSVSAGTAMITAASGSISGSTSLTVNPPTVVSITVTPANSSIPLGTTEQFTATGTFSDNSTQIITSSVTWSSSATSIATISNAAGSNGQAVSVSAGATTITATSGSTSGSAVMSVTGVGSGTANNVLTLTVNGSTCDSSLTAPAGYTNDPCVSVKVCSTSGASTCVTINSILLDTGSYGLRIFKQLLNNVSLTQVASGSGSLAECIEFADGSSEWGPVQTASIIMGNEPAVQVPIQVIDSTFGTVPRSCGTPDQQPLDEGFNGILGVGPLIYDCGTACANSSHNGIYYSCSGSRCRDTAVPLSDQVPNPVAFLLTDNTGLIVQLPDVATGGAASVSGSVVFGISTQSNNSPSGMTTYTLDQNVDPTTGTTGDFTTTFNGSSYSSFIDTGSNALFFPSPSMAQLPNCSGDNSPWFCPPETTSNPDGITNFSATITGYSGSPSNVVSFSLGNFVSLASSTTNMVFGDIGGDIGSVGGFDWGLPFFFGRNVYIGFEGKTSSLGAGPYFAY